MLQRALLVAGSGLDSLHNLFASVALLLLEEIFQFWNAGLVSRNIPLGKHWSGWFAWNGQKGHRSRIEQSYYRPIQWPEPSYRRHQVRGLSGLGCKIQSRVGYCHGNFWKNLLPERLVIGVAKWKELSLFDFTRCLVDNSLLTIKMRCFLERCTGNLIRSLKCLDWDFLWKN